MITNRREFFGYAAAPLLASGAPTMNTHRVAKFKDIPWPEDMTREERASHFVAMVDQLERQPPQRETTAFTVNASGVVLWGVGTQHPGTWKPGIYVRGSIMKAYNGDGSPADTLNQILAKA